jgi:hypothetical protein
VGSLFYLDVQIKEEKQCSDKGRGSSIFWKKEKTVLHGAFSLSLSLSPIYEVAT